MRQKEQTHMARMATLLGLGLVVVAIAIPRRKHQRPDQSPT